MSANLTVGALFAGYGGIELALHEVLGAEPAWFSEIEPAPSRILAHHWPDVPNHGDVTATDWAAVEPVDIIAGGSPCQDLSHAGKRAGMKAGTRSGLWASMCDAIETIRPSLVVWENVRGALSAPADSAVEPCPICVGDRPGVTLRALGRVLGDLAELGYDAAWTGLRAADVGAPHGRWRVFVIAWPAADTDDVVLGEHSGGVAGSAPGWERWHPRPDRRPANRDRGDADLTLLPTPAVNDMGRAYSPDEWDEWTARMQAAHGNGNGHGKSLHVEALRLLPTPQAHDATDGKTPEQVAAMRARTGAGVWNLNEVAANELRLLPTPRTSDTNGAGAKASGATYDPTDTHHTGTTLTDATVRQADRWGQYAPAIARWEALTCPAPDPTEPTGRDGAHRLSPRFVEWMMGLPAGWVTDVPGVSRNDQLKALGNGVVPQQAAAALRWLLATGHIGRAAA